MVDQCFAVQIRQHPEPPGAEKLLQHPDGIPGAALTAAEAEADKGAAVVFGCLPDNRVGQVLPAFFQAVIHADAPFACPAAAAAIIRSMASSCSPVQSRWL